MRKPNKLKPAGKRRKVLADFRDTYAPSSGVSNGVDLKPMAHGKQQIAGADLFTTEKQIVNRASKVAKLTRSVSLGNLEMGRKPLNHVLSDEESKQCHKWDLKKEVEELKCSTWSNLEDEESFYCLACLEFNHQFLSDDESYEIEDHEIEDRDLHRPMSFPGPLLYTPDGLVDFFGVSQYYPRPELEFKDDFGLDNDNRIDGNGSKGNEKQYLAEKEAEENRDRQEGGGEGFVSI